LNIRGNYRDFHNVFLDYLLIKSLGAHLQDQALIAGNNLVQIDVEIEKEAQCVGRNPK